MCEICKKTPCISGCPNAPLGEVFEHCDICRGPIRENEDYMENGGDIVCMDCVYDMTACEAFEHFGYVRKTTMGGEIYAEQDN